MRCFGYWLYTPEKPTEGMPLIVYLRGANGKGEDLNLVVANEDFPKYLQSGELGNVQAYVLIPQLPAVMCHTQLLLLDFVMLFFKSICQYCLLAYNKEINRS